MKKTLYFALLAIAALGWSCSEEYDDAELRGRADDLAGRIDAVGAQLDQLNSDLETYANLVAAMGGSRYITGVSESAGTVTITYDDNSTDVLRPGARGEQGEQGDTGDKGESGGVSMPQLRIDPDTGCWQVSTDGGSSWADVLDAGGNPVKGVGGSGEAGEQGAEGPAGKAPVLGIGADGYWTADYGNGNGAQYLTDSAGNRVAAVASALPSSIFASAGLSEDMEYLEVELISGQVLEIPVGKAFVFLVECGETEVFEAEESRSFPLSQRGVQEIAIERPDGWGVKVLEQSVEVTAPSVNGSGEIVLYAVSANARLKLAAISVRVEGGTDPVPPVITGNVELDKLYGYGENTTGGEGATEANIHHFDDGAKFQQWLLLRQKNKSTTPAIVWLSGTFTKDQGRSTSSPWFDIKETSNITIYGTNDFRMQNIGFFLVRSSNIIIRNVWIEMPKADNGADGISMQNCENVWVDHCTFQSMNQTHDYEDGSCDVTHATHEVTVSWCHFITTQKTCLVGHSSSATGDTVITTTFHHNFFDGSSSRHPRVRYGRAHVYNNYYNGCTTYGAGSACGAMVLVENNCFDGVHLPTDISTYPAKQSGSSWVSNLTDKVAGFLYECNNEYINKPSNFKEPFTNVEYTTYNGDKIETPYVYADFQPAYDYVVDEASRIPEIVPSGAGVGKLPGFERAPVDVDNGGIADSGTTDPDDPDVPEEPIELANGWKVLDYNGSSVSVAATDGGGLSMTALGKFESSSQTFGYVYREVTGDFVMTAAVDSYETPGTSNQSLAGLLLTPDPTASGTAFLHVAAAQGPSGYYRSVRVAEGNASRGTLTAPAASTEVPAIVKIERSGDKCSLSYSLDGGATFGTANTQSFTDLPETVCIGLAVSSGNNSNTATARFGEVLLNGESYPFAEE